MRIFRGNVGVDLSLDEFTKILEDDDKIDDLLNIIYTMEMDEAMNYDKEEILKLEKDLMQEIADFQKKQKANDDTAKMKRILAHLEKYGK